MNSKLKSTQMIFYLFFLICTILIILFVLTKSFYIALVQAGLTLIGLIYGFFRIISIKKYIYKSLSKFIDNVDTGKQNIINSFNLPIIIIKKTGEIIWYNTTFRSKVMLSNDHFGENINVIIQNFHSDLLQTKSAIKTAYLNKTYDVYFSFSNNKGNDDTYVMFFIESTKITELEKEIELTKPVVALVNIDNFEDIVSNTSTEEKNKIINEVEIIINNYFSAGTHGVIKKVEKDLFVVIQESKYIFEMINNKFNILDKVRAVSEDIKVPATLSIGIGLNSNSINESEQFAKQSLDMALGRGGDQVVIKRDDSYEFFGGISSGRVKSTKVKTRIVASSLVELIEESENVIIMGHRFADLDCCGAAIGMAKGVKLIDDQKEVHIVIDKAKNLAQTLLQRIEGRYDDDLFVSIDEAGDYINKKTLLIVVDTHIKSFLESIEVYQSCKQVVVIDHHRKMVNHINDAVIFYHEPSASSTCEMVTELLQYFSNKESISSLEADALLAGIMLDTRNFVIKTGVRTFEAAAYLKKRGANTIAVKKLFSGSMECYQKKTRLVSSAEFYNNCAISVSTNFNEDLRVISAQAADELLTINDIDASFVIYEYNNNVHISARSMGTVNVQLIMEYLGGGGHLAMAGVQLKETTVEQTKSKLLEAIDKYKNS